MFFFLLGTMVDCALKHFKDNLISINSAQLFDHLQEILRSGDIIKFYIEPCLQFQEHNVITNLVLQKCENDSPKRDFTDLLISITLECVLFRIDTSNDSICHLDPIANQILLTIDLTTFWLSLITNNSAKMFGTKLKILEFIPSLHDTYFCLLKEQLLHRLQLYQMEISCQTCNTIHFITKSIV